MARTADRNPLRRRLAALRRRLRLVITVRAVGWLVAVLLLAALGGGLLDWAWRLPPLVRAVVLVSAISGAGVVAFRSLLRPLFTRMDDLTLALRIEERYPSLNDSLASTVQFMEQAEKRERTEEGRSPMPVSPAMRLEAVRRALHKAQGCDFNRVIDMRGLRAAGASGLASALAAGVLLFLFPVLALTALARLTDPFGAHEWPKATLLELEPHKERIGRNEAFEVKGHLKGVIPEEAQIVYHVDSAAVVEHKVPVKKGDFAATFRPGQLQRSFRFQVRANDAVSEWHRVEVAPPPMLATLNGRGSPQVKLFFPKYTGLENRSLPDGTGNIDAPLGTMAAVRAGVNVPLRAAWLEVEPENTLLRASVLLPSLGGVAGGAAVGSVARDVGARVPATLSEDRRSFFVEFRPRVSGNYVLYFEDETGLENHRRYTLQVRLDPAPVVTLERPSRLKESLEVLPDATLPLRVLAEDPIFGLRSMWLEYRTRSGATPRRVPLFGAGVPAGGAKGALLGLAAQAQAPARNPRSKSDAALARSSKTPRGELPPTQAAVERPLRIADFKHEDGSSLKNGDVLTIRACADDFDDVTPGKGPGVSTEVEIRIVDRGELEGALDHEEGEVQKELRELRQLQREALEKVTGVENRAAETRKLTTEDLAELARAEQVQQQLRERLEAPNQEKSALARVRRILETLEQNKIERSSIERRMAVVRDELDRLRREELQQIESRLATARKQGEVSEEVRKDRQAETLERAAAQAEKQAKRLEELARAAGEKPEGKARLEEEVQQLRKQAEKLREEAKGLRAEAREAPKDAQAAAAARAKKLSEVAEEQEQRARRLEQQASQDRTGRDQEFRQLARDVKDSARALRREAQDQADAARSAEKNEVKAGLTEARRRQEEVEKTLTDLLQQLEHRSTTREVKGELRDIFEEQRRLGDEIDAMKREQGIQGARLEDLEPRQRARLNDAVAAQKRLRERTEQLLQKMKRLSEQRKEKEPETAAQMRQAFEQGRQENVTGEMKMAQEQLEQNQLNQSRQEQERALDGLSKLLKSLEEQRAAELGRQIRDMQAQEKKLAELADRQDELRRKVREAEKLKDPREREEALRRLAREQKKLQEEVQEAARQLSRMQANRSAESLNQSAKQMEQAVRRLERGEAPAEQQDEALDRLDEAWEDLEKARNSNEEELAREQLAKVADVLKRLKERYDRQVEEAARIRKEVLERKGWVRVMQASLNKMARAEKGLSDESRSLADRDLASAPIFARIMRKAADAMEEAADEFGQHLERVKEKPEETVMATAGERAQKKAQRRLQQLIDALKMDEAIAMRPQQGQKGGEGGEGGRDLGDNIPPLAQLKLLRALQGEVNQRTREFAGKHPDEKKLTDDEKKELQTIQREQREVAELVEEYTQPEPLERGKP
jgi:hypothetical protein